MIKKSTRGLAVALGVISSVISFQAYSATSPTGKEYDISDQGLYYQIGKDSGLILVDADWTEQMVIPATVQDMAVTSIADEAFKERVDIESVKFGANIQNIGSRAFQNSTGIVSVDWSDIGENFTVNGGAFQNTSISGEIHLPGNGRFYEDCLSGTKITKVIFDGPAYVSYAVEDCPELTEIEFCEGISSIWGFNNCPKITKVSIPASVKELGLWGRSWGAFMNCVSLSTVEFAPGSVLENVYERVFHNTAIKALRFPDSVKVVNNLTGTIYDDLWVPPLVTKFQAQANRVHYSDMERIWTISPSNFGDFERPVTILVNEEVVSELTVPSSETSLGLYSIAGVKKITIANSVRQNTINVRYCPDLEEIEIGAGSTELSSMDHNPSLKRVIISSKNKLRNTSSWGYPDFEGCSSLESISLPGITEFRGNFIDCGSLLSVEMPDVEVIYGGRTFENCVSLETVLIPKLNSISDRYTPTGSATFKGCSSLRHVDFPLLQIVPRECFMNCEQLSEVNIPMMNEVQREAFSGCRALESFPFSQCKIIGRDSFKDCVLLQEANLLGLTGTSSYDGSSVDNSVVDAFGGCTSLKHLILNGNFRANHWGAPALELVEVMEDVKEAEFRGVKFGENASIVFYGNIENLWGEAFRDCSNLEKIVFKGRIANIGANIFYGAEKLKTVDIADIKGWLTAPGSDKFNDYTQPHWDLYVNGVPTEAIEVNNIDSPVRVGALAYSNIRSVKLGCAEDASSSLGLRAFFRCDNLATVELGEGFTKIGDEALAHTAIKSFVMPESVVECGTAALQGNRVMESMVISPNLKHIPNGFAYGAYALKTFIIPEGVESIGYEAINLSDNLKFVSLPSTVKTLSGTRGRPSLKNLTTDARIYVYTPYVPYAGNESFNGQELHVPVGFAKSYLTDNIWSRCNVLDDIGHETEVTATSDQVSIFPNIIATPEEELDIAIFKVGVYSGEDETYLGEYLFDAAGNRIDDSSVPSQEVLSRLPSQSGGEGEYAPIELVIPGLEPGTAYTFRMKGYTSDGILVLDTKENAVTSDINTYIDTIENNTEEGEAVYYDIHGFAVKNPAAGIYIRNGRKVVIR